MNVFQQLGVGIGELIAFAKRDDEDSAGVTVRRMKDFVRRMDDKMVYSPMQMSMVFSELMRLPAGNPSDMDCLDTVVRQVRHIYGEYHPVLGDAYASLSDALVRRGLYARALEYAGQALVVRANRCGILHDKTAESHFALGVLYRYLGLFEKSRQELYICRGIRAKLHGDPSISTALCDLHIGHTEMATAESAAVGAGQGSSGSAVMPIFAGSGSITNGRDQSIAKGAHMAGYVAYYRCFHTRYLELGPSDPLTVEAQQLVLRYSTLGGERLVSALELKLRISELQWTCENTSNWLYSVALFVGRLRAEDALTLRQVRQMVASAIRFSDAKLNAVQRPAYGVERGSPDASPVRSRPSGPLTPTSSRKFNRSMEDLTLKPPSTDEANEGSEQDQVQVITSMLMMIPKPFLMPAQSPSKRSEAASPIKTPIKTPQGERGLPKLRVFTPGAPTGRSPLNSPAAAEHSQFNSHNSSEGVSPWALDETSFGAAEHQSPSGANESKSASSNDKSDAQSNVQEGSTTATGPDTPSSKFQSKVQATERGDSSPSRKLPENWKPLKSAYASLAWTSCHHIQSVDFAIGLAESVYARDKEGILLVIRRALGDTVEEARRNEALAEKQTRRSLRKSGSSTAGASVTGTGKRSSSSVKAVTSGNDGGGDPKAALNALFGKRAPPGGGAGNDIGGGDTKAKLNALFSKPPGGPSPPVSTGGSVGASSSGPVWATDIPFPPPIPTTWPPEPHTEDAAASGAVGGPGAGGGGGTADGAGGTVSTIVNADGTVVTITLPAQPAAPKVKLKQIYLTSLPSIENTLWAETGEELISPEELFDDLEAEFTLEKPKTKKPNQQAFGGGGAAGQAGLKAVPGLGGGGKGGSAESVLDAQRAQNINIMLAKFGKKSFFDLAQSVRWFEAESIGAAAIASLTAFLPTSEECTKVTAFVLKKYAQHLAQLEDQRRKEQGDAAAAPDASSAPATASARPLSRRKSSVKLPSTAASQVDATTLNKLKLGKAEQYIFVFAQVSKLEVRLAAMSSVLSAKETSDNILNNAELILAAVTEVRGSGRLKFLLKAFLDLNNALSKAAKQQEKLGSIKLESLAKITQTKTNSGETAEQYVVNKVMQHFPDALKVASDMPTIDAAKAVVFPRMVADLRKLEEGIVMMRELVEVDKSEASASTDTGATAAGAEPTINADEGQPRAQDKSQVGMYLQRAETVFAKASKKLAEAQGDFAELCVYLGEEPPGDPEKIFGQIIQFVRGIQAAAVVAESKLKKKKTAAPSGAPPAGRPHIKLPNMIIN